MVFGRLFRRRWLILRGEPGVRRLMSTRIWIDRNRQGTSRHHSEEQHAKLIVFMSLVRRRLSWLVGAWLLCQIANVAAAPLTFCCQNVATAGDEEKCCPGLLPGQVCPMHHTKEGERTCKMRSVLRRDRCLARRARRRPRRAAAGDGCRKRFRTW